MIIEVSRPPEYASTNFLMFSLFIFITSSSYFKNYALIILNGNIKTVDDWTYSTNIDKQAIESDYEFAIPTEIEVYGIEGIVTSVSVNGEEYNESTLIVEEGKVYVIEVFANEVSE